MHTHIHKKYESLSKEIEKIPEGAYQTLRTFCNNRNTVELISINGNTFVVKRYKIPNIFNRFIYTFFRRSKAQRAYENTLRIMRNGISTPFPVAYIETKKGGLFHTGYFVSEYMDYPTLETLKDGNTDTEEIKRIKEDFTSFTIELHEKHILPLDYNPKNIFFHKDENSGHYKFALTDINRAKFGNISRYKDTMRSFEQLGIPVNNLCNAVTDYTERRNLDLEASLFFILYYRIRKRTRKFVRKKLRLFIKRKAHKSPQESIN